MRVYVIIDIGRDVILGQRIFATEALAKRMLELLRLAVPERADAFRVHGIDVEETL